MGEGQELDSEGALLVWTWAHSFTTAHGMTHC